MRIQPLFIVCLLMLSPFETSGVTPVHMGKISIDTSIYQPGLIADYNYVPGPFVSSNITNGPKKDNGVFAITAFKRKSSKDFDLFSYSGIIGTTVVPVAGQFDGLNGSISCISFSQHMVDDDNGWENIVVIRKDNSYFFKVFDTDGTELLSDSGYAYYGFDGNCTYVVAYSGFNYNCLYNSWRFRTNISTESPKSLAKTKSIQPSPMQIYGLPGGDYRVTLTPSSGNQINFQMFDLLGRCVFDKQIGNLNRPVSFTVPEGNVPNSPFIAKVNDGNNTIVKKQIPVK